MKTTLIKASKKGDSVLIVCPPMFNDRARSIATATFSPNHKGYIVPKSTSVATYLLESFTMTEMTDKAFALIQSWLQVESTFPKDYTFLLPPRPYQWDAIHKAWGRESFALFMQMRTGKTFVSITLATARFQQKLIDRLVVMCPSSAKPVWDMELQKHCPADYHCHILVAGKIKSASSFVKEASSLAREGTIPILVVGEEAMSTGNAPSLVREFVHNHKAMIICDESVSIKNHKSKRSKNAWEVADLCSYRCILNGLPVTQGIEDLWSQFRFLDWTIIREPSAFVFRHRYCVLSGMHNSKIIGYRKTEELIAKIAPFSYLITTKEAIGLPEIVYQSATVEPSPAQKKAIKDLKDPMASVVGVEYQDVTLTIKTTLEKIVRQQQIVGGHFPYNMDDSDSPTSPIIAFEGKNPKIEEMVAVIKRCLDTEKVIIWSRFSPEIDLILERLQSEWGDNSCVWYRGGMTFDERKNALIRFQDDPSCRFFVANQSSGGRAIDLAAASVHIYYSNTFSLDDRQQSEARTNSSLQVATSILIVDLHMAGTIDGDITRSLRRKKDVATYVQGLLEENR